MAGKPAKRQPPPRLNIRKAVIAVAVVDWAQVITVLALAIMYFAGIALLTVALLVLLIALILVGNYVMLRRAVGILNAERAMGALEESLESATELNQKLRVQRHDFMNHLQVVYSLMEMEHYAEARGYIDRVYKDIQNVSRLMRTENAAVNALLSAKAEEAAARGVLMEFNIRSRVAGLTIEPWELCAIFGNILDNAFDALEGGKDGDIVRVHLWEDLGSFNFSIENNGPVIPAGVIEQVFEPGFTTKGGRGQGLGLHIVRQTLEGHGGSVDVSSGNGWTKFSGSVPLARDTERVGQWNS